MTPNFDKHFACSSDLTAAVIWFLSKRELLLARKSAMSEPPLLKVTRLSRRAQFGAIIHIASSTSDQDNEAHAFNDLFLTTATFTIVVRDIEGHCRVIEMKT